MSSCSICGRKATRAHPLNDNICKNCSQKINDKDYHLDLRNSITSIDSVQEDDILDVINDLYETCTKPNGIELNSNLDQTDNAVTMQTKYDYKDSLLASLYSQVEFLRGEIEENNLLIRTLILREGDVSRYRYTDDQINSTEDESSSNSGSRETFNESISSSASEVNETQDIYEDFNVLYAKFKEFEEEEVKTKLNNELDIIRKENHGKYIRIKDMGLSYHNLLNKRIDSTDVKVSDTEYKLNLIYGDGVNPEATWKIGTTLIVGDSMLYGINESKIKNAKVRIFPGASIEDLVYHLTPLLRQRPSAVVVHIGTNNCVDDHSRLIMRKLMNLKMYILSQSENCKIVFSSLINRNDNAKAQLTVNLVNEKLNDLQTDTIDNSNIDLSYLGRKGLHMTPHGTGKLAVNIIRKLKCL